MSGGLLDDEVVRRGPSRVVQDHDFGVVAVAVHRVEPGVDRGRPDDSDVFVGECTVSLRARLTLEYTGLFLSGAVLLLGLNYALLYGRLYAPPRATPPVIVLPSDIAGTSGPSGRPPPRVVYRVIGPTQMAQAENQLRRQLREETLRQVASQSAVALAVAAVGCVGAGWLLAGRMLRPITAITATARRASGENLHLRIALPGPHNELKDLADTIDAMLARLDAAFSNQQRFIADASHELRTPLTIMRTSIDVALAKPNRTQAHLEAMALRVRSGIDRAERLIESLLTLARSEHPSPPVERYDLATAAAEAAHPAYLPDSAQPVIHTELEPAPVTGDPDLLDRLAANLVDNAVRYNEPDGWVRIRTGTDDGFASLRVTNTGPKVPADQVADLFNPYRRLGNQRTHSAPGVGSAPQGAGLGLAIVRSIVTAHGGRIDACSRPGGGLDITVLIPCGGQ